MHCPLDWFGSRYLTSNILRANDPEKRPLGHRYKVLEGNHARVLVFGFIYNMEDACDEVEIVPVEQAVTEVWFLDALEMEFYDAIMVLAHMDMVDPLVDVIRSTIRDILGSDIPIQFITGHTHHRNQTELDINSASFEAGRYLDTLGFVSFPSQESAFYERLDNPNATLFKSVFLDTNVDLLSDTLGSPYFVTPNGKALSEFIDTTRQRLGLTDEVGCAPMDYVLEAALDDERSVFALYRDQVVPKMLFPEVNTDDSTSVMLFSKDSFRYNILSFAPLIVDDIWAIAPFNDTITLLGSFTGTDIVKLNETMNENGYGVIPSWILIGDMPDDTKSYKLFTNVFGSDILANALSQIDPNAAINPTPTPFSSTLLWMSFVMDHWPCQGPGRLPDWFPTPDKVTKKLGRDDDDNAKKVVTALLIILLLFSIYILFTCCRFWWRIIVGGHQPIFQDEADFIKAEMELDETEESEESQGSDNLQDETELTEDDHEML